MNDYLKELIEKEKESEKKQKKLAIILEDENGKEREIFVGFNIMIGEEKGICIKCNESRNILREFIRGDLETEENDELSCKAKEIVKDLHDRVEKKMLVCGSCFDDDFLKKRKELYIKCLEESVSDMGIKMDIEKLKSVLYK